VRGVYQGEGVWYIPISITLIWICLDTVHYVCVHTPEILFDFKASAEGGGKPVAPKLFAPIEPSLEK